MRNRDGILTYLESRRATMVDLIRQMVELESPSQDKQAVDRCGDLIASELAKRGARIRMHRNRDVGNQIQADFGGRGKPLLLLGHHDTVWDVGTLATMPFRRHQGRLWGPGVFDMKAGIALLLFALDALRETRGSQSLSRPVTVLLSPDEEIGSAASRAVTEAVARRCAAVLVLEPAQGRDGKCKTARKGVGDYTLKVTGVAAHAGLDFEKGQSAILELARQIERVAGFTDLKRGITFNVGLVRGGTRTNVIAEHAEADVDVRIARLRDTAYVEKKMRSLKPVNRHCKLEVLGGINRPPLERTAEVARLYAIAQERAAELGFVLGETAVGGGSDGNFTAVLAPTLDGLGPVGEGAHAKNESVLVSELPRRAALIARLIESA